MNNIDETEIKSIVRDIINENDNISLTYLENKVFLIDNLEDDERIEQIVRERDLGFRQDMQGTIRMEKSSFEAFIDSSFEKIEDNTKKEKSEAIIEKLICSIYDEMRFDTFYEMYKEKVKEHVNNLLEKKLVNSEVLDIEGYISEPEEVMDILRKKEYVIETIFNEHNEGFVGIVRK